MTRWRTLIPLLGPMLAAGAIDRLPAHLEPQGMDFWRAQVNERTC